MLTILEIDGQPIMRDPDAPPPPTLDELLEGFWGGKDNSLLFKHHGEPEMKVWQLSYVDHCEKGPDAFSTSLFRYKETALWNLWSEWVDVMYSCEEPDITEEFERIMTKLQSLRDDGYYFDGDFSYTLSEEVVL